MTRPHIIMPSRMKGFQSIDQGNDANTVLLLHMEGADAHTVFADCSAGNNVTGKTWTAQANAQADDKR